MTTSLSTFSAAIFIRLATLTALEISTDGASAASAVFAVLLLSDLLPDEAHDANKKSDAKKKNSCFILMIV
jgi:hypothetical protein